MKYLLALFVLSFPLLSFGQRGDVPITNPDNAVGLKVVFQKYTVTTSSHHGGTTTSESEYLNLKVNDLYLPEGDTGISDVHFRRYLINCPKAYNISLDGLSMYNKASNNSRIGNLIGWTGFGTGLYFMFQDGLGVSKGKVIRTMSSVFGGLAGSFVFKLRANNFKKKGHKQIINAFDLYAKECYNPSLQPANTEEPKANNSDTANGDDNNDENILIDNTSNNAESKFISLYALSGISMLDAVAIHTGPDVTFYKKGFYLNATAYISKTLESDLSSDGEKEFGYSATASFPFLKGRKKIKKAVYDLGKMQGIGATAVSESMDMDAYKAYALDIGIHSYRQNISSFAGDYNDYIVNTTLLRAGISRSIFIENSFTIDDNRFSEKIRYSGNLVKLYANAVYNYKTDYQIFPSLFKEDPVLENDLGFVLGVDVKYANKKNRGISAVLEAGKFPIFNGINSWAGQLKIGYGFYSVDRSRSKPR